MSTEINFTLPKGYLDEHGRLHKHGRMRLATVMDEIEPGNHPKSLRNESYALVLLMARVITQLGDYAQVTPEMVERIFAVDMLYLEDLYLRLNAAEPMLMDAACPHCQAHMQLQVAPI